MIGVGALAALRRIREPVTTLPPTSVAWASDAGCSATWAEATPAAAIALIRTVLPSKRERVIRIQLSLTLRQGTNHDPAQDCLNQMRSSCIARMRAEVRR